MTDERAKVLQMIQDGKISVEEGMELLDALGDKRTAEANERFLRVRVDDAKSKVNVNIPLKLLKLASTLAKAGMGFIPAQAREEMEKKGIDLSKIDFDELVDLIAQGLADGKLVDVESDDDLHGNTKVEVYVE